MAIDARRTMLAAVSMAAVLAAACEKKPAATAAPAPPPEVYVADVVTKDVPVYVELVGQAVGYQDVEIRARVEGFLETMKFQEGSFVRKGDLLYEIDRKPLEAGLAAAKADQAAAQARLEKANNDVTRYRPLEAKQAVSKQELDNALAAQDAATAQVEAAKAAVEKATLDLSYTRVTAPIDGLAGTTLVKPGNLVGRGQNTLLTTISQINPILFRAGVTEADYLRIVRNSAGARAGARSGIQLTLADGTVFPRTGTVSTVDRAVDPNTGTLGVQFEFPNPGQLLRPGQFGRARVLLDTKAKALLVPQRAVQELQNLHSVGIVDAENKVTIRNVKVGPRVDAFWVIEEGVKLGDRVVVEGMQRVQDGMMVAATVAPPEGAATATAGATQPKAGEK